MSVDSFIKLTSSEIKEYYITTDTLSFVLSGVEHNWKIKIIERAIKFLINKKRLSDRGSNNLTILYSAYQSLSK
jgi:hypothetical protein